MIITTPHYDRYIYITREYRNGVCIDKNTIGIGQGYFPLTYIRVDKEHRCIKTAYSDRYNVDNNSTVETVFEYIFEYPLDLQICDFMIHNELLNKGYKNFNNKKSVFVGISIEEVFRTLNSKRHCAIYKIINDDLVRVNPDKVIESFELKRNEPVLNGHDYNWNLGNDFWGLTPKLILFLSIAITIFIVIAGISNQ